MCPLDTPFFHCLVMIDEEKAISMLGSKSVRKIAERIIDRLAESHKNRGDGMYLLSLRSHMLEVHTEKGREKLMRIINSNSDESNPDDFLSQPGLVNITKEFVNELVRELNQMDTVEKKVEKKQTTKKKASETEEVIIRGKRLKDLIEKDSPESEVKKPQNPKKLLNLKLKSRRATSDV
ncbi:hypothetical protein BMS3Bbin15_00761 [archaeon BMS3Bbin15]|nr:hypothetical protein BMS3Bbin15_00761 [archaeon BMS3Bbin15]